MRAYTSVGLLLLLPPVLLLAALASCGRGNAEPRPVAHLSSSLEAQAAFGPLREAWSDPRRMPRAALRAKLEVFVAKYSRDGLRPLAQVYLAFVLLDEGNDARARAVLSPLGVLPPGATRDLGTVAEARLLRRAHDADRAFELLRPLVGKLVDAEARSIFGEEITLAALESQHAYEAVAYMDAWLRAASEDEREAVRAKVRVALERLDPNVELDALRAMRTQANRGGYGKEIERLVTERLGAVALERGDSELARWLVAPDSGAVLIGGEAGNAVAELASVRRGLHHVAGRTIGLLLPTRNARMQDESAEVIRGLAWALDLPRRDPTASMGVRLVTRDAADVDARERRLDEIAGEGAAVIVTALSPDAADVALRWAEARRVPVITLSAPRTVTPGAYGFVLGESRALELAMLAQALAARKVVKGALVFEVSGEEVAPPLAPLILGAPGACEGEIEHAAASPFPLDEWQKDGVRGWVVSAPADCARKLVRQLTPAQKPIAVALTLEAAPAAEHPEKVRMLAASAGVIPMLPDSHGPARDDVAAFAARLGRRPDWWAALGRDTGMLAKSALAALPMDDTLDEREVRRRRDLARAGLEASRATLWTSEADRFDARHVVERVLRIVDVPPRP